MTIGQYPFFNFDGNAYLNNQQQNFINYVFAQNGSETNPNAGLGAFAQLNATSTLQFAVGFQNAAPSANFAADRGRFVPTRGRNSPAGRWIVGPMAAASISS